MAEQVLEIYNSLTLEAQKEVDDFAFYLASQNVNINHSQKKSDISKIFGSLQKYANPDLIQKEQEAWTEAVVEKYRS